MGFLIRRFPSPWGNQKMKPKSGNRIVGLDHLRALAALMVFFWHGLHQRGVAFETVPDAWVISALEEGWVGVTLFITITGFVFTVITNNKDINYLGFLKNRILRLLPLIFMVTLYAVTASGASNQSLLIFFTLLGGGTVYGTWTLVVEFQFYIAYPYLRDRLVFTETRKTLTNCGGLVLLFVMLRLACFYSKGNAQDIGYWTIFGQADAFVAGIIAGVAFLYFKANPQMVSKPILILWIAASLILIVFGVHWFNQIGGFYGTKESILWVIWPTISAALFASVIAPYCLLTLNREGAVVEFVAYLGTISYSTYMLHFITLALLSQIYVDWIGIEIFDNKLWNEATILLLFHYPITIAISAISFELIEKSFVKHRVIYLTESNAPPPVRKKPIAVIAA